MNVSLIVPKGKTTAAEKVTFKKSVNWTLIATSNTYAYSHVQFGIEKETSEGRNRHCNPRREINAQWHHAGDCKLRYSLQLRLNLPKNKQLVETTCKSWLHLLEWKWCTSPRRIVQSSVPLHSNSENIVF